MAHSALATPTEPVVLEQGTASTGKHEVVLEADKDTPSFEQYELKGDHTQFPKFLIRELPSGRTVGSLKWPGDSSGDHQPLRNHTRILWRPDGKAVVINTSERHYSGTSVFALQKTGKFIEVPFPDYKTLTGHPQPKTEDLRPRGFGYALRWTAEGLLVYEVKFAPEASYSGADPLHHRITLRVSPEGMEVIARAPLDNDS